MSDDLRDALNAGSGDPGEALDLALGRGAAPQSEGPAFFAGPRQRWWRGRGVEERTLTAAVAGVAVTALSILVSIWLAKK